MPQLLNADREGRVLQDRLLLLQPCRASRQHEAWAISFVPSRLNRRMEPLVCHLFGVDRFES